MLDCAAKYEDSADSSINKKWLNIKYYDLLMFSKKCIDISFINIPISIVFQKPLKKYIAREPLQMILIFLKNWKKNIDYL